MLGFVITTVFTSHQYALPVAVGTPHSSFYHQLRMIPVDIVCISIFLLMAVLFHSLALPLVLSVSHRCFVMKVCIVGNHTDCMTG